MNPKMSVYHVFVSVFLDCIQLCGQFSKPEAHTLCLCVCVKKQFRPTKMTNNTVNNLTQYEKHCATNGKHTFAFGQQQIWVCACFCFSFGSVVYLFEIQNFQIQKGIERQRRRDAAGEEKSSDCFFIILGLLCIVYEYIVFFFKFCYGKMCKNSKWIQTHLNQLQWVFFSRQLVAVVDGPRDTTLIKYR